MPVCSAFKHYIFPYIYHAFNIYSADYLRSSIPSDHARHLLFTITENEDEVNCPNNDENCDCPNLDTKQGHGCYLQCVNEADCDGATLTCRSGDECGIICDGTAACSDATMDYAIALCSQLVCDGEDSCKTALVSAGECNNDILCSGKTACGDAIIDGSLNIDISLNCNGEDSCKDTTLLCGYGACNLFCSNDATSCEDIIIDTSNATSFTCTGNCGFDTIPSNFGNGASIDPANKKLLWCLGFTYSFVVFQHTPKLQPCFLFISINIFRSNYRPNNRSNYRSHHRSNC